MNTPKLKPCPFCGGKAKMETITDIFHRTTYTAVCGDDGCLVHPGSDLFDNPIEAAAAWNTRPGEVE